MLNYSVEDFTIPKYREFIIEAEKRFIFSSFEKVNLSVPHILLRHDLDLSVTAGLKIATLEYELGVSATYFVQLHSPFYNLLDKENYEKVRTIASMGHRLGLHFDSHFYNIQNQSDLNDRIIFEKNMLGDLFNVDVRVFSFHLTNEFTMQCKEFEYGGLINAYAAAFQTEYDYCSDSYGFWRHKRLFDFIRETQNSKLQILTHPEWWVYEPTMPKKRIQNIIDEKVAELYADAERNYIYKENVNEDI